MESKLHLKPEYALLEIRLAPGEKVVSESGAMVSMDPHLTLTAAARGGLLKGLKRAVLGGESFFQSTYEATTQGGCVYLAPGAPGDIVEVDLREGESLMIQSSCYLASTADVKLDTKWGGAKGFFSGTGMFLLAASGPGRVWVSSFGAITIRQLGDITGGASGDYVVDTGHIVAFDSTATYNITKVGGIKSLFFSGEGLVARFSGKGRVMMQTRNPSSFASFLHAFRPVEKNSGGD